MAVEKYLLETELNSELCVKMNSQLITQEESGHYKNGVESVKYVSPNYSYINMFRYHFPRENKLSGTV